MCNPFSESFGERRGVEIGFQKGDVADCTQPGEQLPRLSGPAPFTPDLVWHPACTPSCLSGVDGEWVTPNPTFPNAPSNVWAAPRDQICSCFISKVKISLAEKVCHYEYSHKMT